MLEAEVVAGGGDQRRVGGQRDRRICAAVAHVANDVFGRHVLGVGRAAAVAAEVQRAAAAHCLSHHTKRSVEIRPSVSLTSVAKRASSRSPAVKCSRASVVTKSSPICDVVRLPARRELGSRPRGRGEPNHRRGGRRFERRRSSRRLERVGDQRVDSQQVERGLAARRRRAANSANNSSAASRQCAETPCDRPRRAARAPRLYAPRAAAAAPACPFVQPLANASRRLLSAPRMISGALASASPKSRRVGNSRLRHVRLFRRRVHPPPPPCP